MVIIDKIFGSKKEFSKFVFKRSMWSCIDLYYLVFGDVNFFECIVRIMVGYICLRSVVICYKFWGYV